MKVTHISLWPPHDDSVPRVQLGNGIITDKKRHARLAVSDERAEQRQLPWDVTGWRVFVSRRIDGEFDHVYEGTVTDVERVGAVAGYRRILYCEPGGFDGH